MREFNLEEAKAGKEVCTRSGDKARILCMDVMNDGEPIVAAVKVGYFREIVLSYNRNGKCQSHITGVDNPGPMDVYDLMMVTEKHTGWVNIWRSGDMYYPIGVYGTYEEARVLALPTPQPLGQHAYHDLRDTYEDEECKGMKAVDTIQVSWED